MKKLRLQNCWLIYISYENLKALAARWEKLSRKALIGCVEIVCKLLL